MADAGWTRIRLGSTLLRLFTRINLLVLLGNELADRPEVYEDMMAFFWDCAKAFPILNFTPTFLLP
ncbi:MAG: hypothetical protein LQ337_002662 [Flavoplaca oasis]|nr:MAG: hypothetical protein LQ337_002662 [Flavoplaca oasis]